MVRKLYEIGKVILGWLIANLLGVATLGVLIFVFPYIQSIPGMVVSSLIIGLPIGFAQWIALRRVAPISILWTLTITAGLLLGLVMINSPIFGIWGFLENESILSMAVTCTIIGLFVGLGQWSFLRGHFTQSFIWPLSSAVGFGLGIGLVLASNLINQSGIISIILVFLVYTTSTGLVKYWLMTSHRKATNNLANAT